MSRADGESTGWSARDGCAPPLVAAGTVWRLRVVYPQAMSSTGPVPPFSAHPAPGSAPPASAPRSRPSCATCPPAPPGGRARRRRRARRLPRLRRGDRARALSGAGGGDPRDARRQERDPQHADRARASRSSPTAAHFDALAEGKRSVYTRPIKALASEKFFALCRDFGADNVGMMTGDATVNRDAPIICCTAEILAEHRAARRAGAPTSTSRSSTSSTTTPTASAAWPGRSRCSTLPHTQFLLMSATFGNAEFFRSDLTALTGARHDRRALGRAAGAARLRVPRDRRCTRRVAATAGERQARRSTSSTSRSAPPPKRRRTCMSIDSARRRRRRPIARGARTGSASTARTARRSQRFMPPRHRHPPRGPPAEVPPPRREARAERAPQDHQRHRHARRRRQRPDPHRALHEALQVRRREAAILSVRDSSRSAGAPGRKGFDDEGSVVGAGAAST